MLPNIGIDPLEQEKLLKQYDTALSDPNSDFTTLLHKLWASQLAMVEKYGRDGLALLLDYQTRVYVDAGIKRSLQIMHYSEMPETCPWYPSWDLPKEAFIQKIWGDFSPEFTEALATFCVDVFVIFEDKKWFLAYAYKTTHYDGAVYYEFLGGCQPDPKAKLPKKLLQAGWKMPEDLRDLYAIHSNFGHVESALRNEFSDCIPSAKKLETSLDFLEEYVEAWEVDYSFFNLLPFWEDGAGNCQNFYKVWETMTSYLTVDWDHETKEISGGSTLPEFINYRFGDKLRGES